MTNAHTDKYKQPARIDAPQIMVNTNANLVSA